MSKSISFFTNDINLNNNHFSKNDLLNQLISKQRILPINKKLLFADIKRLSNNLNNSIFNNDCVLWQGYISVDKNQHYIHFHLNKKKIFIAKIIIY